MSEMLPPEDLFENAQRRIIDKNLLCRTQKRRLHLIHEGRKICNATLLSQLSPMLCYMFLCLRPHEENAQWTHFEFWIYSASSKGLASALLFLFLFKKQLVKGRLFEIFYEAIRVPQVKVNVCYFRYETLKFTKIALLCLFEQRQEQQKGC
jgi:hypothetical protein